jgi:TIGR02453 family protein
MFTGFPEETITYFLNLRFNNYTSYYQQTKDVFIKDVQTPFFQFIEAIAPTMQAIDPLMEVRPAKCLARIRRDTRFTKDKTPYRDHLWLLFRRAAEPKDTCVMYWFELSPDEVLWGLGFWGENRPAMDMFRRQMVAKPKDFINLIDECKLKENHFGLSGSDFKRLPIPDSLPPSLHPWYIKKQLYLPKMGLELKDAFSPDLVARVAKDFTSLAPMYRALRGCTQEQA